MLGVLFRLLWRFLILALGVFIAWVMVFQIYPYADTRLPAFVIFILFYCIVAYGVIPLLFRLHHIINKPDHIPRYVVTGDGWPADPVNIAFIAKSEAHLRAAMTEIGWYTADKMSIRTAFKEVMAIVFDRAYPRAPFGSLYFFDRKFDIGFQLPSRPSMSPRHRHHVRIWQLHNLPGGTDDSHFSYWMERFRHLFKRSKTVWIGAAVEDIWPIGISWHNLQITHHNGSNHETERDLIIDSLRAKGLVKSVHDIKDGEPFTMRSQNIGTTFIVDGYIKVVELKAIPRRKKRSS